MITKLNFKDKTIKSYAIRKLTPFECFLLMGVRTSVIHIMQSTISLAKARIGDAFGHDNIARILGKPRGKDDDMVISPSQQYKQAGNSIVVDVLCAIYENLFYPQPPKQQPQANFMDLLFPEDALPPLPSSPPQNEEKLILTTFSGYDSQLMAADALKEKHPDFRWRCVGWSDIDKYACQMHNLVFPQYANEALGDITQIDWQAVKSSLQGKEIDLFTYSSPCQDISQAGKQMGLKEGTGTRSALLWRVADAIEVLRPKYLLQENVAALMSEKFMPDFQKWLDKLKSLGYVNFYAKLNAKDYGVPQNRDRVFCVSLRKDVAFQYQFPEPIPLERRLEDVLEEEVDEKYFLKDDAVAKFLKANDKDAALFRQYDLLPCHADAMFLKTWLQYAMEKIDGWNMKPTELELALNQRHELFCCAYDNWKLQGTVPDIPNFWKRFTENMNRQ